MAGWDNMAELVREELIQREQEGYLVGEDIQVVLDLAGQDEAKLFQLYRALSSLPTRSDFPYDEPSALAEIRAARPQKQKLELAGLTSLDEAQWQDKFLGAWQGRAAGCALGKPLERWDFMHGTAGRAGWQNVKAWFEGAEAWPIAGYTPGHSRAETELGLKVGCPPSQRENIHFMESDDDLRYTILGLLLLEDKGLSFDSWDIGKYWHKYLSYNQVCTAETQAYLNFAQVTSHLHDDKPADWPAKVEWVRSHLNPYREWIGAQIRADGLAYGAAGRPELAAELAWRDAAFSHVKNGIYGEMFVAAVIAAAFVESDNEKLIECGLAQIPANSRLADDIHKAIEITRNSANELELVEKLWQAFSHYNPVHTNNNAALVTAALLFGGDNFEKAITTAVLGGWDTDCNGATVGSIMGAKLGAARLPAKWVNPLNDTLYAEVRGFDPIAISECARRSYAVWRKLQTS